MKNINAQNLGRIITQKKSASSKRNLEYARKVKAQKKAFDKTKNVAIDKPLKASDLFY